MKNLFAICLLLVISSCGNDDGPSLMGEVNFDGNQYAINSNYASTRIMTDELSIYHFNLSDGPWTEGKDGVTPSGSTTCLLQFTIKSPNAEKLDAGLYQYDGWEPQPWEDGPLFFGALFTQFDIDSQSNFDEGTISISGNYPNLQISFDLVSADGKTLTGSISGSFSFIDYAP